MDSSLKRADIIVKPSSIHGYGVFAREAISKDEIIEECYTLTTNQPPLAFDDYYYDAGGKHGLVLGYGSLYNHADDPNASLTFFPEENISVITALKPIQRGEEICVSYGDGWFSTRYMAVRQPSWFYRFRLFCQRGQLFFRFGMVVGALMLLSLTLSHLAK